MPDFSYENEALKNGYKYVCGVDEAGRGPLAGPVCAAAVILPEDVEIEGLNDSKKLSEKRREALYDVIKEKALAYCVAYGSLEEIEEFNILEATFLAMNRSIEGLGIKADYALIDGNRVPKDIKIPCETVVKGDAKSASIAAASVLAKVSRDRYITQIAQTYPGYGFEKHKGYGTKAHTDAIAKYGLTPLHRPSFCTKFIKGGK